MVELLWITKTAQSESLSHSVGREQLEILSQAQRISRRQRARANAVKKTHLIKVRDAVIEQCINQDIDDGDQTCSTCVDRLSSPVRQSIGSIYDVNWTPAERRSATYFQEMSVYKILTLQRDSSFWQGLVPCSAEVNPGIRHLVVAIAATHELLLRPHSTSLLQFALNQCNKALRSILSSNDTSISVLLTSCILVSAYNLLRGDVEAADKSIESGLQMSYSAHTPTNTSDDQLAQLSRILTSFGKQHGFKLWAPDIAFKIDRTVAGRESLIITTNFPKGPFVDAQQVLTAYKEIMTENVAKPMRNLSLGAHIKPDCPLAQAISQNFSDIFYHWEMYYRRLSECQADENLQLIQLKIGFLSARILFCTKIIESNKTRDNAFTQSYAEIAELGQEVIAARDAGRSVIYQDRIVNGAVYTSSLFCRDPRIKRQMISLLKRQVVYADGLVNFLRGHVAELVAEVEERGIVVKHCCDIPEERRIRVSHLHCGKDRILCMQYMLAAQTDRLDPQQHFSKLPAKLNKFSVEEIDNCLQGMTAAYTMYRKVDLQNAPRGYLRKMYHDGRPVQVTWRADLLSKHADIETW